MKLRIKDLRQALQEGRTRPRLSHQWIEDEKSPRDELEVVLSQKRALKKEFMSGRITEEFYLDTNDEFEEERLALVMQLKQFEQPVTRDDVYGRGGLGT